MGVYALREISRRNYDSAWRVKPWGHCHNSWGIFLIDRKCPYINKFITWGSCKMNTDRDTDGLFSSALPLTCSDSALSRSLYTTYEMGKPWDERRQTAHLNHLVFISLQQRPVREPCHHLYACTNVLRISITPLLRALRPCYECDHSCAVWFTQNSTCAVPLILWLPK